MIAIIAAASGTILGAGPLIILGIRMNRTADREQAAEFAASDARQAARHAAIRAARKAAR